MMIELTERQRNIVEWLDHDVYTVEFLGKWLAVDPTAIDELYDALQYLGAAGFFEAVKRIELMSERDRVKSERHN